MTSRQLHYNLNNRKVGTPKNFERSNQNPKHSKSDAKSVTKDIDLYNTRKEAWFVYTFRILTITVNFDRIKRIIKVVKSQSDESYN